MMIMVNGFNMEVKSDTLFTGDIMIFDRGIYMLCKNSMSKSNQPFMVVDLESAEVVLHTSYHDVEKLQEALQQQLFTDSKITRVINGEKCEIREC